MIKRIFRFFVVGVIAVVIFQIGVSVGRDSRASTVQNKTVAVIGTRALSAPAATDTPEPLPTKTMDEIKASSVVVEYKDLYRNIETYSGKILHATGEIVQVAKQKVTVLFGDDYETTVMRVNITKGEFGNYSDTIWIEYGGEERFLEGDIIEFWATVKGLREYESLLGATVELPWGVVDIVELKESP